MRQIWYWGQSSRERKIDKTSASQTVQTSLQSVNESYHLHLKQSYHAGTAASQPLKKTCSQSLPLYQPALSLLLSSSPFISSIFLPFGVCICDRSGHSRVHMCLSLLRRGSMIKKCVDTHLYVSKTSVTRRGNVCGCVLKQLISADRWLTEMTSSIRHFSESP